MKLRERQRERNVHSKRVATDPFIMGWGGVEGGQKASLCYKVPWLRPLVLPVDV